MEWVQDAVGCALDTAAEGVVVPIVVVVAHIVLGFDVDFDVFSFDVFVACWSATLVFDVDEVGVGAAAVVSLGDIDLGLSVFLVAGLTTIVFNVDWVSGSSSVDINVNVYVGLSWTTVAARLLVLELRQRTGWSAYFSLRRSVSA
jgi:hypothetical protein